MFLSLCLYISPHISAASFHQPPSVFPTHHVSVIIHTQNGVAHWLICLCHTVAVTFDVLTQLPKMSTNYLLTVHHSPHLHLYPSSSVSVTFLSLYSIFVFKERLGDLWLFIWLFFYFIPIFFFHLGCDYNKPGSMKGTVVNMTG